MVNEPIVEEQEPDEVKLDEEAKPWVVTDEQVLADNNVSVKYLPYLHIMYMKFMTDAEGKTVQHFSTNLENAYIYWFLNIENITTPKTNIAKHNIL